MKKFLTVKNKEMEITYENIRSIIVKEAIQGNQIQLEFKAKNQDIPFPTIAVVVPNTKDITKNVGKEMVKSTVKRGVINGLLNAIGLGGLLGSAARSAAYQVSNKRSSSNNMANQKITEEDKQKAIIEAFKPFESMYNYNEQTHEWEYAHQS